MCKEGYMNKIMNDLYGVYTCFSEVTTDTLDHTRQSSLHSREQTVHARQVWRQKNKTLHLVITL